MRAGKGKVLIVEDEAIVAMELEIELSENGYEVVGKAMNGLQAIQIAKMKEPNIILMDINLKGEMDGIEASRELLRHFSIPILFVSASSDNATMIRVNQIPGSSFLAKPFTIIELSEKIESALS
jgi:DNA-binding response OmpR family regulator